VEVTEVIKEALEVIVEALEETVEATVGIVEATVGIVEATVGIVEATVGIVEATGDIEVVVTVRAEAMATVEDIEEEVLVSVAGVEIIEVSKIKNRITVV
jgi:hypothetical protein